MSKQSTLKQFFSKPSNIYFLIFSVFLSGILSTAFNGTFHNFLADNFELGAKSRGFLEFPRELPGLLATFIIGLLFFLGETKILAGAMIFTGIGLLGMGNFTGGSLSTLIFFMIIWSTGAHVHMILREPIAIDTFVNQNRGAVLGKINGIRSAGIIIGTALIWILMGQFNVPYSTMYAGGFVLAILAGVSYLFIKIPREKQSKKRFVFILKKRYKLFYLLASLFGIRKQLFLVFAPWLLIKRYEQGPENIALLLFVAAAIGIFVKPYLGKLIDKFGERKVLFIDSLAIILISIFYAFTPLIFADSVAIWILYSCFIADELLYSLRTARTTYLYRIAETKSDITPTLSMGISIEHIVSMIAPFFAGWIWIQYGFQWVFIMAAGVAIITAIVTLKIPRHSEG